MVTRLDSAAFQTAPWPRWALGGSVPLLTYPHPSAAFGKSCQSQFLEGTRGVCAGELLLQASPGAGG